MCLQLSSYVTSILAVMARYTELYLMTVYYFGILCNTKTTSTNKRKIQTEAN